MNFLKYFKAELIVCQNLTEAVHLGSHTSWWLCFGEWLYVYFEMSLAPQREHYTCRIAYILCWTMSKNSPNLVDACSSVFKQCDSRNWQTKLCSFTEGKMPHGNSKKSRLQVADPKVLTQLCSSVSRYYYPRFRDKAHTAGEIFGWRSSPCDSEPSIHVPSIV